MLTILQLGYPTKTACMQHIQSQYEEQNPVVYVACLYYKDSIIN